MKNTHIHVLICKLLVQCSLIFLFLSLPPSLPDDDTEYSVFDYYVDESGEWDIWQSKWVSSRAHYIHVHIHVITCMYMYMYPHANGSLLVLNIYVLPHSRLSETRCQGVDLFGEVFVETATTVSLLNILLVY